MILVSAADAEPLLHSSGLPSHNTRLIEESRAIVRLQHALMAAISATGVAELTAAVEAHAELLSPDVLAEWKEHGVGEMFVGQTRTPAQTTMDQLPDTLLDDLTRMPAAQAWPRYVDRVLTAQNAFGEELEREIAELVAASDRGEASRAMADRCVQIAEWVVPEIAPAPAGLMWFTRGVMLINPSMSAPDDIEDAISALEIAAELADAADDPVGAAGARSNLVVALQMRPRERELSLERAITVLEELVNFWESLPDPDRAALVRTNLAVTLLDRKTGDPVDNARQALDECVTALQHRSPELNPVDYVYTLANKALAHRRLAESDPAHLEAAEEAYQEALSNLPPETEPKLLARIFYNHRDFLVAAARLRPRERAAFLARAEMSARRAVQVHADHGHTHELAFAQRQLARMLSYEEISNLAEARDLLFQALQVLTPEHYPADCIATADDAIAVCQSQNDWEGASRASLTALAAWLASGGDTVGREDLPSPPEERDLLQAGQKHESRFRFTAYTMFRAAQQRVTRGALPTDPEVQTLLEQAVGIIEAGRATALRAASGADVRELQRLRTVDPTLAEAYLSAFARVRAAAQADSALPVQDSASTLSAAEPPFSAPAAEAGSPLQHLLAEIRSLPGFSDFAQGQQPSLHDIRAALKPGQAVIYLIAHPVGCCALVVTPNPHPEPVLAVDLPSINGARLFTLTFGFGTREDGSIDGLTPGKPRLGEALLTGANFSPPRHRRVLSKVLAEIGITIAQPLARTLRDVGITDAVLVPCGLLPIFAWHAATWSEHGVTICLSDALDTLSYAPSAGAWLAAHARAARLVERPSFLVGLANPSRSRPPLPAAEAELRHIASRFPVGHTAVAYRGDATGRFLLNHLPHATHLHLGCHGTMRYDSVDGASLALADGEQLDIARIRRLAGDGLRLVVVAACVSGAVNVFLQPEESHALNIGFMHAGAAGVLGTLWPIQDLASALFITRFYEGLTTQPGVEPAVALAQTQQWMRRLTTSEGRQYAAERPALSALHRGKRLRTSTLRAAGRRRLGVPSLKSVFSRRPFAAPEYWAAFVLNGC
ncbi:CHAT domain-containing protein [Streptomyces sp. NPDC126522]|uniref:CHAT domain-containing protein n=1 Tax=Streptomyces sp. NPDC126522 TaxID=3155211 RepID=UPI0033311247